MGIRNMCAIGVLASICASGVSYAAVASADYVTQHVTQLRHDISTKEDVYNNIDDMYLGATGLDDYYDIPDTWK